jgi:hypothetical protein
MASNPGIPVVILASGGRPVTQLQSSVAAAAPVMTPNATLGQAITLVVSGGLPAVLINTDGTDYVA